MSRFFLPILLVVGFGIWKLLDHLQLPNTFSILLLLFVLISGISWVYYRFSVLPRRKRQITRIEQRTGKPLTDEEKAKIERANEGSEFMASLFPVLLFVFVLRSFLFEPFQIPSQSMEPTLRVGDFLLVEKFAYGIKDPIFQNTLIETGSVKRGDVVVFKAPLEPNVDYIKRVVGIGGDRVIYNELERSLTITYGKDGQPCHENCETKTFSYENAHKSAFPSVIRERNGQLRSIDMTDVTEIGNVKHQVRWYPEPVSEGFRYNHYEKQENYSTEWIVPEGHYFVMGDNRNMSNDSRFWGFVPEKSIVGKATYIWLSLDKLPEEWPSGIRSERIFTKIQ